MTHTLTPPPPPTPLKACWTTLITKPNYLQGLIVLHSNLIAHASAYPLVVMVTPELDDESKRVIEGRGIKMVEIESLRPGKEGKGGGAGGGVFERFGDTWTKLRAFELIEYEVSLSAFLLPSILSHPQNQY